METALHQNKTFDTIDYSDQRLSDNEFVNCEFINCNFSKSDLTSIDFLDCTFKNCNLSLAILKNTGLKNIQFIVCKLSLWSGVCWRTMYILYSNSSSQDLTASGGLFRLILSTVIHFE